jgi:putative ABC transport system permease protein
LPEGVLSDTRVIAIGVVLIAGAWIATAIVPVVEALSTKDTRGDVGRTTIPGRSRARDVFLATQVALAVLLTIGAGMFRLSVQRLTSGVGYEMDSMALITLDRRNPAYVRDDDVGVAVETLADRLRQSLGRGASVALSTGAFLDAGGADLMVSIRGQDSGTAGPPGQFLNVTAVSPTYFDVAGTRVLSGRAFIAADRLTSQGVCILDEGLARSLWPGVDPLGKCATVGRHQCLEIVGITESRRRSSIARGTSEVFVPLAQVGSLATGVKPQLILFRSDDPADISLASRLAADVPGATVKALRDLADIQTRSWRLGAAFLAAFGTVALLLAVLGVYWSTSFSVRSRRQEFAVRMALGAEPANVRWRVFTDGLRPVLIGVLAGLLFGRWVMRAMESLFYGVDSLDASVFALSAGVVVAAAAAGCVMPSLRASRTSPAVALRDASAQ